MDTPAHRHLILAAAVATLLGSCSVADPPLAPASRRPDQSSLAAGRSDVDSTGFGVALLSCAEQPYASATETIGPEGGRIVFGEHTLLVPARALSDDVTITAEALPGTEGNVVQLSPEGLRFDRDVQLTLDYGNCLEDDTRDKTIVYLGDDGSILEELPSMPEGQSGRVRASLQHFSRYAVAW